MSSPEDPSVYIKLKDFSVSQESFSLLRHPKYDMLITHPQPEVDQLPRYYASEDYISHTDSKRNLFEYLYHIVKQYALSKKLTLIEELIGSSGSLLDVGCGTGDFLKKAEQGGWRIQGIEPNNKARALANSKITGKVFSPNEINKLKCESYDVITLWHVLEHLPNFEQEILKFKTLLKPNGFLIIAVPNFKSHDATYYKEYWAAFDVPRHLWHFSINSITQIAEKVQLGIIGVRPMKFDAYYVSLLSEKYKHGKMNLINGLWRGFVSNWKARANNEYSSLIYILKNKE